MAEPKVKSLFQRLTERRAMIEAGDPTGGTSMGSRGADQKPVQRAAEGDAAAQIAKLEADLAALKAKRKNMKVGQ
jgi:hypothetical protein